MSAALVLNAFTYRSTCGTLLLVLLLPAMSEWALPSVWLVLTLDHTWRTGPLSRRNLAMLAISPVLLLALV